MRNILLLVLVLMICSCKKKGCVTGDCINGYSKEVFDNGGEYIGFWKYGQPDGFGTIYFGKGEFDGDTYKGFFKDGKRNGKGNYYSKRHDSNLIGNFKNGKADGDCVIIFGKKSDWVGSFSGKWIDGVCKEFDDFAKKSKNGEYIIYKAGSFFDTINYYYKYSNIKDLIYLTEQILKIELVDKKLSFNEISKFIDTLQHVNLDLEFSINKLNGFKEFDPSIPYKKVTIDYLNSFKIGFDNEIKNWILISQHTPDKLKRKDIYNTLMPFAKRIKIQEKIWLKTKDEYFNKYKEKDNNNS